MTGHVMPAFPHTLIGLGPFADLGCKIVFTKTSVTVYHPDGHPILSGWQDETGPRLWHFPLTTEAAQVALENASPQPPILLTAEAAHVAVDEASHPPPPPHAPSSNLSRPPRKQKWGRRRTKTHVSVSTREQKRVAGSTNTLHRASASMSALKQRVTFILPPQHIDKDSTLWRRVHPDERTTYCRAPLPVQLAAPIVAPLPGQPHPSQGLLATSATGAACLVYYIYGAAQAVALAAQASGTPFDPRSLDLPSIGALVGFYHACLAFQSNRPGWMPSKPATATPSRASPTPMLPSIVRTQMKQSWAISPSNAKTSGRQNPSSLRRSRWWFCPLPLLQLQTRYSS